MIQWDTYHDLLSTLFDPEYAYAGYKPAEAEIPNADGIVDTGKRYLHIARKYDPPDWAAEVLATAHWQACLIAERIGVPDMYYPRTENGTLRVLEYSAGAGSSEHTDFDLFTVNLWRSSPIDHEWGEQDADQRWTWHRGAEAYHVGELGEIVGMGRARMHRVIARPYAQRALVYFAMPANSARLPFVPSCNPPRWSSQRVGEWVAERTARSRVKL